MYRICSTATQTPTLAMLQSAWVTGARLNVCHDYLFQSSVLIWPPTCCLACALSVPEQRDGHCSISEIRCTPWPGECRARIGSLCVPTTYTALRRGDDLPVGAEQGHAVAQTLDSIWVALV